MYIFMIFFRLPTLQRYSHWILYGKWNIDGFGAFVLAFIRSASLARACFWNIDLILKQYLTSGHRNVRGHCFTGKVKRPLPETSFGTKAPGRRLLPISATSGTPLLTSDMHTYAPVCMYNMYVRVHVQSQMNCTRIVPFVGASAKSFLVSARDRPMWKCNECIKLQWCFNFFLFLIFWMCIRTYVESTRQRLSANWKRLPRYEQTPTVTTLNACQLCVNIFLSNEIK